VLSRVQALLLYQLAHVDMREPCNARPAITLTARAHARAFVQRRTSFRVPGGSAPRAERIMESSPARAPATRSAVVVLPVPGVPVMRTLGSCSSGGSSTRAVCVCVSASLVLQSVTSPPTFLSVRTFRDILLCSRAQVFVRQDRQARDQTVQKNQGLVSGDLVFARQAWRGV
jgi:hypothetical protein